MNLEILNIERIAVIHLGGIKLNQITKSFIYRKLNDIKDSGIDVSHFVKLMIGKETIPYEVIVFVNQNSPIDNLCTYNNIYNKRRKSPLFRNIVSDKLSIEDKAIVLSSLLNQSFIGVKHESSYMDMLTSTMNCELIIQALQGYMNGNKHIVEEVFDMYQTIFKTLFPRNTK